MSTQRVIEAKTFSLSCTRPSPPPFNLTRYVLSLLLPHIGTARFVFLYNLFNIQLTRWLISLIQVRTYQLTRHTEDEARLQRPAAIETNYDPILRHLFLPHLLPLYVASPIV